jgi:hypothetical protein
MTKLVSTAWRDVARMWGGVPSRVFPRMGWLLLGALTWATFLMQPANSQPWGLEGNPGLPIVQASAAFPSEASDEKSTAKGGLAIPPGTILPVRLMSTISSANSRPGQAIKGRIMQDVPLTPGVKIRKGSKVLGHIVEVTPASAGAGARVSLQFDKLVSSHETIPIRTNLRAIAGFMRVDEALTPTTGPGESDVFEWLTTVQVGGDVVYGLGGPVTAGDDPNLVVGKRVNDGVLGQARAMEGARCRGPIEGNNRPQALWVFSSDACGTYGLDHVQIEHAGRTDPVGVVVLASDSGNLKIPAGAGMLLRAGANGGN